MLEPRASSRKQDSRAAVYTSPWFHWVRAEALSSGTPSMAWAARGCSDCQARAPASSFTVTVTPSAPASRASWAALPSSRADRGTDSREEAVSGAAGGAGSSWEASGWVLGSPSTMV